MEVHRLIIVLCISGLLTLVFTRARQLSRKFVQYPSPTVGPVRLSVAWTDRSLVSCIFRCMTRYPDTCESAMYNHGTQICTPGQGLDSAHPVPSEEDGDLYAVSPCDPCDVKGGFELHTYNTIRVCVFNATTVLTSYSIAGAFCQDKNAHLYTPKTLDKLLLLANLYEGLNLWVGLDDIATEGKYIWSDDGTQLDPSLIPSIFSPGEPNDNSGLENCILTWGTAGKLNDGHCGWPNGFVCEQKCHV